MRLLPEFVGCTSARLNHVVLSHKICLFLSPFLADILSDLTMPSPNKKRKLNSDQSSSGLPSRGLEYFFAKQRENVSLAPKAAPEAISGVEPSGTNSVDQQPELTDEELARKLQAEWDAEVQNERANSTPCPEPAKEPTPPNLTQNQGVHPNEAQSSVERSTTPGVLPQAPKKNTLSLSSVANAEDTASSTIPLDQSPLTFDPSEFVPRLKEQWAAEGGHASYAFLTRCFILVNATQSRIKIVDTLVNCIRVLIEADPDSLLPAVWLATNAISPPYISLELGLGGSAISKALKQVCGLDSRALKTIYDKYGDAGDVAFEAKKKQSFTLRKPKSLTIAAVYQSLVKIANSQGQGSGEVKQRIVDRLLQDARGGEESRYIVRTLCQHVSAASSLSRAGDNLTRAPASHWCCQNHHADSSLEGFHALAATRGRLSLAVREGFAETEKRRAGRSMGQTRRNSQGLLCTTTQLQRPCARTVGNRRLRRASPSL